MRSLSRLPPAHRAAAALLLSASSAAFGASAPDPDPAPTAPAAATGAGAWDLEIAPLRPGLFLIRRPEVLRQPVEPNVAVIVNDRDVVVVDGGGTPLAAENAIRLIRSVTDRPVSVLVNTHWHGDHCLGNQAYRAAFPGIAIVGHDNTRRDMTGSPMKYVERLDAQLRPVLEDLRARKARGKVEPRQERLIPDLETLLREAARTVVTPPDVTVRDRLVLHRPEREIEILHPGKGNTEGDLVVWLPREKVLLAGDLLVEPIPYGFGSFPAEWIETLERLAGLGAETIVPGHGEPQKDLAYLRRLQALLREVRAQVGASVAKGLDLEQAKKALDLSALEKAFTLGDERRKVLWQAWWVSPIARSAWLEAKGLPIVQGASDETG